MTSAPPVDGVALRDVTLRDGLQLSGKLLAVDRKVEIVRTLLDVGIPEVEIGSMARPDLVPPMANTLEVIDALEPVELDRCWIWVATPGHVGRAGARGARNFQYCLSASSAHNRANVGRDTEDSLAALPAAIESARSFGGRIQLCIATAFTCPFEGVVAAERVLSIIESPHASGVDDVVLADTLGQAIPAQVAALVSAAQVRVPQCRIVFHGHDTWGLGVANSLAAVAAGAVAVDGALGGLGGCPFAPGASGNSASEDLLFAMRPDYLDPQSFARLVKTSERLLADLGEQSRSKAAQGARSRAAVFEWVISEADKL